MELCKDCKYYSFVWNLCKHTKSKHNQSLITGDYEYKHCNTMRDTVCRYEAKLFEQKVPFWKRIFK